MAEQIARAVAEYEQNATGHAPKSVTVMFSDDTLVVTLRGALSRAEMTLAQSAQGAGRMQEFHRRLFDTSSASLRDEIKRITGVEVREAAAEVEPATGAVVSAFATGTVVQVFLLDGKLPSGACNVNEPEKA